MNNDHFPQAFPRVWVARIRAISRSPDAAIAEAEVLAQVRVSGVVISAEARRMTPQWRSD